MIIFQLLVAVCLSFGVVIYGWGHNTLAMGAAGLPYYQDFGGFSFDNGREVLEYGSIGEWTFSYTNPHELDVKYHGPWDVMQVPQPRGFRGGANVLGYQHAGPAAEGDKFLRCLLTIVNDTGSPIQTIIISYRGRAAMSIESDINRFPDWNVYFNGNHIPELYYSTAPGIDNVYLEAEITGLNIAPNEEFVILWESNSMAVTGTNFRRQVGISDVSVEVVQQNPYIENIVAVNPISVGWCTSLNQALADLPSQTQINLSDGTQRTVDLSWGIPGYDGELPSDYMATASFQLPHGVDQSFPPTALEVSTTVRVMEPPAISCPENMSVCENDSPIPIGVASPGGGTYYFGDTPVSTLNPSAAGPGSHLITYEYTINTCKLTCDFNIQVHAVPLADAGPDIYADYGSSVTISGASASVGSIQWEPASLFLNPNVEKPSTRSLTESVGVTLTVTSPEGCVSTDQLAITVSSQPFILKSIWAEPSIICNGETTRLHVTVEGGTATYNYSWVTEPASGFYSNDPNPLVQPNEPTTYRVFVRSGEEEADGSITVEVRLQPELQCSDVPICEDAEPLLLSDLVSQPGGPGCFVLNGQTISVFNPVLFNPGDKQQVTYNWTDHENICSASCKFLVEVMASPEAPHIYHIKHPGCGEQTGSIQLTGLPEGNWTLMPLGISGSGIKYVLTELSPGRYSFWVINNDDCESQLSDEIVIIDPSSLSLEISLIPIPVNGGIVSGSGIYLCNDNAFLTATPSEGYSFSGWYEAGILLGTEEMITITVTGDRQLEARFTELGKYTIALLSIPPEGGTATGGGDFSDGRVIIIEAEANSGFMFSGWTENGEPVSDSASYTFAVSGSRTLVANFEPLSFDITVIAEPAEGGLAEGGGSHLFGSSVDLTATPSEGYSFSGWYEAGILLGTEKMITITVTGDRQLEARFTELGKYMIVLESIPPEGGTATGGGDFSDGRVITIEAEANYGFMFSGWSENGDPVSDSASYTFAVSGSRTLVANFYSRLVVYPTAERDTICLGDSVQLFANAQGGTGGKIYTWATDTDQISTKENPGVSPAATTTYTVEVHAGSESVNGSVTIHVHPLPSFNPLIAPLLQDYEFCLNDPIASEILPVLSQFPVGTYTINDETLSSFDPNESGAGQYLVIYTITDTSTGCTNSKDFYILMKEIPHVYAGKDQAIPYGTGASIDDANVDMDIEGVISYLWTPSHLMEDPKVLNPGIAELFETTIFTLSATHENGCSASDQVTINVLPEQTEPETYSLQLVSDPPGISTLAGAGEYEAGATVNIQTSLPYGYRFLGWDGADASLFGAVNWNTTTFRMPAEDVVLVAQFIKEFSFEISRYGDGLIEASGYYTGLLSQEDNHINVGQGFDQEFHLVPGPGLSVVRIQVDDEDIDIPPDGVLRFPNVQRDYKVEVWFRAFYEVSFHVNMTFARNFDMASDRVYMTGSMFNYAAPGAMPGQEMQAVNNNPLFLSTTLQLPPGIYYYKYFLNEGWRGEEWPSAPVRVAWISSDTDFFDFFGSPADPTSLKYIPDREILVYPNPASHVLHVETVGREPFGMVRLLSLTGQTVHLSEVAGLSHFTVDVSLLQPGIYILQLHTFSGWHTTRVKIGH